MAEQLDPMALKERYKTMVVRGLAAALLLAILSIAEYVLADQFENPTWWMVPFMLVKGWVILDTFMHVRALRGEGGH